MPDLVLHAEASWTSPWVFHAMVALEEKGLAYELVVHPMRIPDGDKPALRARAVMAKVPLLEHGGLGVTESLAISEYLDEAFPAPEHARLYPVDLRERARARQILSYLRTSMFAVREERPTSQFVGADPQPARAPLTTKAKDEADELMRIADQVIGARETTIFAAWCIADADLALALMRLVAAGDPLPAKLERYVHANLERPAARRFRTAFASRAGS